MADVAERCVVAVPALLSARPSFAPVLIVLLLIVAAWFVIRGIWRAVSRIRHWISSNRRRKQLGLNATTVSRADLTDDQPPVTPGPKQVVKSIFISYRRKDNPDITGRIYDALIAQFGKNAVFKDVDAMPIGFDFRDHIREQLSRCAVLIAVIGKNWNPAAASGERRLNDQRDHLRIEIETALERHIPVIPVFVDGVEMPSEKELPPSLAQLAYHHGIEVRPDPDFHNDADRLARGIEPMLK
jgi:hypothetical protein